MTLLRTGKVVGIVNELDITNSIRPPNHEFSIFNFEKAVEKYKKISGNFVIDILDKETNQVFSEIEFDIGILKSWRMAVNCFGLTIFSGSILFSSIAVECVLNHDLRLENERLKPNNHEWLDLNTSNLRIAHDKGLPTKILLENNEDFTMKNIQFVTRRNKIAHGDSEGYRQIHIPEKLKKDITYSSTLEPTLEQSLDQIEKSKKFIIEWAKTAPEIRLH